MTTVKLCILALTGVALTTVIRFWRGDWLPLVRTALCLVLGVSVITLASPLVAFLSELCRNDSLVAYAAPLVKALGIAVLTQCCSELCRECGEGAAASGIELIGKIEILLLSLPLIHEILEGARGLLSLGG